MIKWYDLLKPSALLIGLWSLQHFTPSDWSDPWQLISLKKIFFMVFAISSIQFIGDVARKILGMGGGSILKGFLGGLISSTALTVELTRSSHTDKKESSFETPILAFLSALAAMLVEAFILVELVLNVFETNLFWIFLLPAMTTSILIFLEFRKTRKNWVPENLNASIDFEATFKLTILIVGILVISKILVRALGPAGLTVLTFLLSLFEIHSTVIANVQLFESQAISFLLLGNLLALSLFAAYLSKVLIIWLRGSKKFKSVVYSRIALIIASLGSGWIIFFYL